MKTTKNNKKLKLIATSVASASIFTSCGPTEPKAVQDWRKAPGTNGFINLKDVVEAFQKNPKAEDFENRVNEIFEGDNMVVFASRPAKEIYKGKDKIDNGFVYIAYEDLNKNGKVDGQGPTSKDDPLFFINVQNEQATLYGLGVNKYYRFSWAYKPIEEKKEESSYASHYHSPYYHHWYYGRGWGSYYTPSQNYQENTAKRDKYRQSNEYVSQLNKNAKFESDSARQYGRSFTNSAGNQSSTRKSYITDFPRNSNFTSTLDNNPTSKHKSSSGNTSTYAKAAVATGAVVGLRSRGGSFGGSRGSSGIGI